MEFRPIGQWQERLEHLVEGEPGNRPIEFVNYKLGYFSVFAFMLPFFRWLVVRRFRNDLIKECKLRQPDRIDLVGHSFGTHVIGWAVAQLRTVAPQPVPIPHPRPLGSLELASRSNSPSQAPSVREGHRILFAARRESPDSRKVGTALAFLRLVEI
jgi:hypothetical protein